jgi:nucleoside-diphosphate-sugar epimerase
MRVFVAGATGVVGRQLVPLLVSTGHEVFATTRTADKLDELQAQGARPVLLDVLDADATLAAVRAAEPDAIVHQATALSELNMNLRKFDQTFAVTNQLRTAGTANLLAGAHAAGTARFVAQSYCGWPFATVGGPVKSETAPLEPHPPKGFRAIFAALVRLEALVTAAPGGVVLRYGALYGPGTSMEPGAGQLLAVENRKFPLVGSGDGYWSFLHVHDAATAALAALTRGEGVYNIVDDDPAPVREWLPAVAELLGAPRPMHLPAWVGRLAAGPAAVRMMTQIRAGSNERAKRELAWKPTYPSWRDGFAAELRAAAPSTPPTHQESEH